MPEATTKPTKTPTTLPVLVLDPKWQGGFNFYQGRWFGDENYENVEAVVKALKSQGFMAGVFDGNTTVWEKGKNVPVDYWRVYIHHPKRTGYYAWFDPGVVARWSEPFDPKLATWYEFTEAKAAAK